MIPRLIALWLIMIAMGLSSTLLHSIAENHYHHFCHFSREPAGADLPFLPLISRLFINWEGWIYYYPSLFVIGATWMTWKRRDKSEEIWALIAISLGAMILFTSAFYVAVELPYMSAIRLMSP